jgi:hypothetical protein
LIFKVKVDAHGFVNNSITFDFPILIGTYPIVKHINPPAYPMPPSDYIAPQSTAPPAEICKEGQSESTPRSKHGSPLRMVPAQTWMPAPKYDPGSECPINGPESSESRN